MAMRETVKTLQGFLMLSGGLGAARSLEGGLGSNSIEVFFTLGALGSSLAWIYVGARLPALLVRSPRTATSLILAGAGWGALVSLLMILAGVGAGLVQLVIILPLGWYLLRSVKRLSHEALGPEHPSVATSLNNLAELYRPQGKYAQAEPLFKRAIAIDEKALGPEHPSVATSLNNLAALYNNQGKYAQAEPLYQRSLAIKEKALGPDHPNVALMLENYAMLLRKMDRDAEAEKMEARARAIRAKHAQENPPK